MVKVLPEDVDLALRIRPWLSKVAEAQHEKDRDGKLEEVREKEAIFFKYLPRNHSNGSSRYTFLITNLSSVWLEALSRSAFRTRYGEYLSKSQPNTRSYRRTAANEDQKVSATGREDDGAMDKQAEDALERMFESRRREGKGGWDDFELEIGGEVGKETFELRSEDLFWQMQPRQLSAGQAIVVLRDHFMIPIMGVLGAYTEVGVDIQGVVNAIDTSAIPAAKGRLPQLLSSAMDKPRLQTSMARWSQGWQGLRDKKGKADKQGKAKAIGGNGDYMVQVQDAYDQIEADIAVSQDACQAAESVPAPPLAQRLRSRSTSAKAPSQADNESNDVRSQYPSNNDPSSTPDYDSDATDPEDDILVSQSEALAPHTGPAGHDAAGAAGVVNDIESDATDDEDDGDSASLMSVARPARPHGHMVVESESDESSTGVQVERVSPARAHLRPQTVASPEQASDSSSGPRPTTPSSGNKRKLSPNAGLGTRTKRLGLGTGVGDSRGMISRTAGKRKSVW